LRLLDLASQHPLLPTFALIALVYLSCLGGVLAARMAWRGRPAYWLGVVGAFLFLLGALWGRGYLSGGATFSAVGAGIALAIFGVAIDLIFGPPFGPANGELAS
jgi:hypothetical protein